MPALSPLLNVNQCYAVPISKENRFDWLSWKPLMDTEDWIEEFSAFLAKKNTSVYWSHGLPSQEQIKQEMMRQLGIEPNPKKNTDALRAAQRLLPRIYAVLLQKVIDPSLSYQRLNPIMQEEQSIAIAEELLEGLNRCARGIAERASTVWERWIIGDDLISVLYRVRRDIVDRIARKYLQEVDVFMEVHERERYFIAARDMGYGVHATACGHYKTALTIHEKRIEAGFAEYYTPLLIIQELEQFIFAEIAPRFVKDIDGNLVYDQKVNDAALGFINDFLNTKKGIRDCFIIAEDEVTLKGINWPNIRIFIAKALTKRGFFLQPVVQDNAIVLKPHLKNKQEITYWLSSIIQFNLGLFDEFYNDLNKKGKQNLLKHSSGIFSAYGTVVSDTFILKLYQRVLGSGVIFDLLNEGNIVDIKIIVSFLKKLDEIQSLVFFQQKIPTVFPFLSKTYWSLILDNPICLMAFVEAKVLPPKYAHWIKNKYSEIILLDALLNPDLSHALFHQALLLLMQIYGFESQEDFFKQIIRHGYNVLIQAMHCHPEVMDVLLEMMVRCSLETRIKIFKQTKGDGYNALMFAVRHHPRIVPVLLTAIATLPPEEQIKILGQRSDSGSNAFMLASRYHSQVIIDLSGVIETFPQEQQFRILGQRKNNGCNSLMLASQHNPDSFPDLFSAFEILPQKVQITLFEQINNDGYNALMLAVCNNAEDVPTLLAAIAKLPTDAQVRIFDQKAKSGDNALLLAARNYPAVSFQLLKRTFSLSALEYPLIMHYRLNDVMGKLDPNEVFAWISTLQSYPKFSLHQTFLLKSILLRAAFTPAQWFEMIKNKYVPLDLIADKKQIIFDFFEKNYSYEDLVNQNVICYFCDVDLPRAKYRFFPKKADVIREKFEELLSETLTRSSTSSI